MKTEEKITKIFKLNSHLNEEADEFEVMRYVAALETFQEAQSQIAHLLNLMSRSNDQDSRHKYSLTAKNLNGIIAVNSKEANAIAKALQLTPETRPDHFARDPDDDDFAQ